MTARDEDRYREALAQLKRLSGPEWIDRANAAALLTVRNLLIEKGVFTTDEWERALANAMEDVAYRARADSAPLVGIPFRPAPEAPPP